jgi:hypothetical protein
MEIAPPWWASTASPNHTYSPSSKRGHMSRIARSRSLKPLLRSASSRSMRSQTSRLFAAIFSLNSVTKSSIFFLFLFVFQRISRSLPAASRIRAATCYFAPVGGRRCGKPVGTALAGPRHHPPPHAAQSSRILRWSSARSRMNLRRSSRLMSSSCRGLIVLTR